MNSQLDDDILVNQVAQGFRDTSQLLSDFNSRSADEKRAFVRRVSALAGQAGARESDVPNAIALAAVRPTRTAAVLLARGRVTIQLAQMSTLPPADLGDVLLLSTALLGVADRRRRDANCSKGCMHWWHKDFDDEHVVADIRRVENGP